MIKQAPFKPTDIGGCTLWLDGADPAGTGIKPSNGSVVSTWVDKSGSGNSGTATGGTITVTNNILSFSGTPYFTTPYTARATTETIFIVYTMNPSLITDSIVIGSTSSSGRNIGTYQGVLWPQIVGVGVWNTGYTITNGPTYLQSFTRGSFGLNFFNNGSPLFSSATVYNPSGSSTTNIGQSYYGILVGTISEIIIYNSSLTDPQRQQVEAYLAQKWGLRQQLPPGHPGTTAIVYSSQPIPTAIYWRYPSTFVPTSIGNCQLWLDAADSSATSMTFSSGNILSAWKDKSGSNNTATAYNSPTLTQNAINGYQAISTFRSPYFTGSISITGTTYTLFTVATRSTGSFGNDTRLVSFAVNNSSPDYNTTAASIGLFAQPAAQTLGTYRTSWIASNAYTMDAPFVASVTYTGTNGYMWFNGSNASYTGTSSSGTFGITVYALANQPSLTNEFWNGYIGEVIVYNTSLSITDRQQVEGYLAWKWGLQANLPANHPYKNSAPNTTNPAGISRPANVLPIPPITLYASSRPPTSVTPGAVFHLDAGNPASYSGSGSTWTDLAGSGLTTTLYNSPTYSSANGGYLAFNPNSGQFCQTSASLASLSTWTVEVWHYYNSTYAGQYANPAIVTEIFNNTTINFTLGAITGNYPVLQIAYFNNGWYTTSNTYTLPSIAWYHIVGTYDGTNLKLYINNVLTQTQASSTTPVGSGFGMRFMRRWDLGDYAGGYLAIIRIYNRALSATEVTTNYAASKARFGLS